MEFATAAAPRTARGETFVLFRPQDAGDLGRLPVPDTALRAAAAAAAKAGEFSGEAGRTLLLHGGVGGARLLLAGLGKNSPRAAAMRVAAAAAARELESRGVARATFLVPDPEAAGAAVEGAGLALYRFDVMKSVREKEKLRRVALAPESGGRGGFAAAVERAEIAVHATCFARTLGNLPANVATPERLAKEARKLAGGRMTVRVHDRAGIRRLRMGAFSAVAQGSAAEPRLIELRWSGGRGAKTLTLVGKGVTFDTGGISIKPAEKMDEMKFDMCGAAAVLGCMSALRRLEPSLNVRALIPATDNMPSATAVHPGDIVTARNGTTVEILNTDAEGRLLLCDALAYAVEASPDWVVDLATLTGACVVALGDAAAGLFGTDDGLVERIRAAGAAAGEAAWRLPLLPRYDEMMKGTYADLKNVGGRWGGACTAAAFLKAFVGEAAWAHLDIAGVAWTDRDEGWNRKGATGYGVRTLLNLVESLASA